MLYNPSMYLQARDLNHWLALVVRARALGGSFYTLSMLATEKGCTRQAVHKAARTSPNLILIQGPSRLALLVDNINLKELLKDTE